MAFNESFIRDTLLRILHSTPMLTACAIGFIIAIIRWQRHPRTSLLVALATGLMMFNAIVFQILYALVPQMSTSAGWDHVMIGRIFSTLAIIHSVFSTVPIILFLVAIFCNRPNQSTSPPS